LLAPVAAIAAPSTTSGTTSGSAASTPAAAAPTTPSTASTASSKTATSTTATSKTATAKTATSTAATRAPATTAARYEVVSGTYASSARADKHLTAVTAKGISGLTVHKFSVPSARYRVEERGLTRDAAATTVKALHADHFAGFSFRRS
jgi:hypothetical protein